MTNNSSNANGAAPGRSMAKDPNDEGLEWLDKIIQEQAAYYGMTREQFSQHSKDVAEGQEIHEMEEP